MTDNQELKELELKLLVEKIAKDYVTDSNLRGSGYEPYVKYFKYALEHKSIKQLAATQQKLDVAVEALEGLFAIINDSNGISGYHKNGDIAAWGEFEEVEKAEAALKAAKGE
jgi:hypothetical protein